MKYAYGYLCSFGFQAISKFTELKLLTTQTYSPNILHRPDANSNP